MGVKVLYSCVSCCYCANKIAPSTVGILTLQDMMVLNYSGCAVLGDNRLTNASRRCKEFIKPKGG